MFNVYKQKLRPTESSSISKYKYFATVRFENGSSDKHLYLWDIFVIPKLKGNRNLGHSDSLCPKKIRPTEEERGNSETNRFHQITALNVVYYLVRPRVLSSSHFSVPNAIT